MNRRRFLKAAGVTAGVAVAALAADAAFVETRRLTVTRHRVHSPGTNAAGRAARVVLIADLHLRSVGRFHEHIAHEIARADPQLIVISGDSVDRDDTLPLLDDFLSLLDPATPKFATWGNWEHYIGIDLRTIAATAAASSTTRARWRT
jgi:predicted MPP superfamily phosphohydrolase